MAGSSGTLPTVFPDPPTAIRSEVPAPPPFAAVEDDAGAPPSAANSAPARPLAPRSAAPGSRAGGSGSASGPRTVGGSGSASGPRTAGASTSSPGLAGPAVPGYDLLSELGRGGMGVVYKARDLRLGRVVALKMILAGGHAGQTDLERFRLEAEAIAQLSHPNIVAIYDVGEVGGLPYMALEFVAGGSLSSKIKGQPQPPRSAAQLVATLAEAVQVAHNAGFIHRDLKPANVLLTEDGTPKITDFGLAKRTDQESTAAGPTRTGQAVGTPNYMAPEQLESSSPVGPSADVYALGAILYDLLTGRPPFLGESEVNTIWMLMSQDAVPVRQLSPRVPRDLETVCMKCLAKPPAQRYASAAALAADLRAYLGHQAISARPAGPVERAAKWCRRNPAVAALLGVVALALLGALVGGAHFTAELAHQRDLALSESQNAELARRQAQEQETEALTQRDAARRGQQEADTQRRRAEQAIQVARRYLYAGDMLLAWQAWSNNQQLRIQELLTRWDPRAPRSTDATLNADADAALLAGADLRGFEWHALRRAGRAERIRILPLRPPPPDPDGKQPDTRPAGVAFSHDGRLLVRLDYTGQLSVWDIASDPVRRVSARVLPKPISGVFTHVGLAFSGDGRRIAVGGDDRVIRIVPAVGSADPLELRGHTNFICGLAFGPDDATLVSLSRDNTIRFWSITDGALLATHKANLDEVYDVAFSLDRRRAAVSGGHSFASVWEWDWTAPEKPPVKLCRVKVGTPTSTLNAVVGLAMSPNGARFATIKQDDTVLQFFKADGSPDGELSFQHRYIATANALDYSADGNFLAVGRGFGNNSGVVELWDLRAGQPVVELLGHTDGICVVRLSPDGRRLASGSRDESVRIWDVASSRERWTGSTGNAVKSARVNWMSFSSDGRMLATVGSRGLVVLDPVDLRERSTDSRVDWKDKTSLAMSPNGRLLAVGYANGSVRIYERLLEGGTRAAELPPGPKDGVLALAFSADSKRLAVAGEDTPIWLWKIDDADQLTPDGKLDVSPFRKMHSRYQVTDLAFSPDGRHLVAAAGSAYVNLDGTLMVWSVGDWKLLSQDAPHPGKIKSIAFLPDGRLATGCNDNNCRLWTIPECRLLRLFQGHLFDIRQVAVSPDGRRLASSDGSAEVKLWDTHDGREVASLPHSGHVSAVAFSPSGQSLAVGVSSNQSAGGLRVWRIDDPVQILDEAAPPNQPAAKSSKPKKPEKAKP